MNKVVFKESKLTMERLANPFPNNTLNDRLVKSKAIDLRDNVEIEDLGNGYSKNRIIDKNKLFKML